MSELEPGTEETDYDAHSPGRDEYANVEQEKNPGFLLGATSFVIALLFIIIYFNAGFNSLLLLGAIIFGLAGMLLISSQRGKAKSAAATTQVDQESGEDTKDTLSPFELLVKEALDSIPLNSRGKWITCWYRWKASQEKRYWSEWASKKATYCSDCTRARH